MWSWALQAGCADRSPVWAEGTGLTGKVTHTQGSAAQRVQRIYLRPHRRGQATRPERHLGLHPGSPRRGTWRRSSSFSLCPQSPSRGALGATWQAEEHLLQLRVPGLPRLPGSGCYCREPGRVLSTRVASAAVGGELKELVWFCCWARRGGGTEELLMWRTLVSITWQSICIITS